MLRSLVIPCRDEGGLGDGVAGLVERGRLRAPIPGPLLEEHRRRLGDHRRRRLVLPALRRRGRARPVAP